MKKIHLVPNLITAFGLSCGLFLVFSTAVLKEMTEEFLKMSAGILLLACFADLLDGAVARAIKAESEFGGLFDSLSDAITFGIGPPVIVLKTIDVAPENEAAFFLIASAMIFAACGVLRLVRIGVAANAAKESIEKEKEHKAFFTGLPIPAGAACCLSLNYLLFFGGGGGYFSGSSLLFMSIFQLFFLGYCMVSRLKFPSLKLLRFRLISFREVLLHAILAVFVLWGFRYHFGFAFFIFSWGYLLLSLFLSLARYLAGKRLETLKDFDPDPEGDEDHF